MIHYLSALETSEGLHENMQGGESGSAFSAIESDLSKYVSRCASWHWHEFVEFAYVADGNVECSTPSGVYSLEKGDGYFINSNVLHQNRMTGGGGRACLRVIQFETELLTAARAVAEKYVMPVLGDKNLDFFKLDPEKAGQKELLELMADIFSEAAAEGTGFELRIVEKLFALWDKFYMQVQPDLSSGGVRDDDSFMRLKNMLSFIHNNYADAIDVDAVASAAGISQREAFRIFRKMLDTTPVVYLMKYRVNMAVRKLTETDLSISDVAWDCGFASSSYFCKAFKDIMELSPRDFRKKLQAKPS